ncbi:ATP-binding protein [Pseudonocardia eucalypti]|uniref:histidine kinase n=1 Tax=Pseudonocardia eucalypti TaxID=648755 RepID=A0ABP9PZQ8_9PSEU|nr:sensor histidine kinase regulating citrate/malate metabolism [Pseudonocardia eucalypti]
MTRRTLARQFLTWQLGIVAVLLVAVAGLAVVQSNAAFRDTQGRRMLTVAEDVAASQGVRQALADRRFGPLPVFATTARNLSGADEIVIVDAGRTVRASPDPDQVAAPLGPDGLLLGTALDGHSAVYHPDWRTVVAEVPVMGDRGVVTGVVAARVRAPSLLTGIANAPGQTAALLAAALVIGVVGSLLLARRVRRQTLGLEPAEIVELVHRREAMLLGVKEGVVGMDAEHRITLLNQVARELLDVPDARPGMPVDALGLDGPLRDVLTGQVEGEDQVVARGSRLLVLNRMPVGTDGEPVGVVVTLRDRTELANLEHRLDASRHLTDTLRAQAHEFTNRLHTIAGLTELGEYDEVRRFVAGLVSASDEWRVEVTSKVRDAACAALLVAKASLAAERGVELRLAAGSELPARAADPALSTDLVTVLGNLVDNALDAVVGPPGPHWVEVALGVRGEGGREVVAVTVADSGPGVPVELADAVFERGFSTKAGSNGAHGRGLGLALSRQVCLRRGGSLLLTARDGGGAVFAAELPVAGVVAE